MMANVDKFSGLGAVACGFHVAHSDIVSIYYAWTVPSRCVFEDHLYDELDVLELHFKCTVFFPTVYRATRPRFYDVQEIVSELYIIYTSRGLSVKVISCEEGVEKSVQ